jgi:hypothetical protein
MSTRGTTLAVLLLSSVLTACAVGEALQGHMHESVQQYPTIREWACEPGRAQLVLDATRSTLAGTFSLDGAAIERNDFPTSAIYAGAISVGIFSSWNTVVLFANLQPGVYKVRQLRLSRANAWFTTPVPDSNDFIVTLEPDKLLYLGRIVVEEKAGFPARTTIRLSPDTERRSAAFAILKDRFPTSPCTALLAR